MQWTVSTVTVTEKTVVYNKQEHFIWYLLWKHTKGEPLILAGFRLILYKMKHSLVWMNYSYSETHLFEEEQAWRPPSDVSHFHSKCIPKLCLHIQHILLSTLQKYLSLVHNPANSTAETVIAQRLLEFIVRIHFIRCSWTGSR